MIGRRRGASARAHGRPRAPLVEGVEAWAKAREDDDFASFRPWLDRTLELKHRYIDCFPPSDDPYDALLDDFEPGMKTDEVRRVFERLKPALRDLVAAARGRSPRTSSAARYPARRSTSSRSSSPMPSAPTTGTSASIRRFIRSASRSQPTTYG